MFALFLFSVILTGGQAAPAPGPHGHSTVPPDPVDNACSIIRNYYCDFFAFEPQCGTDGITYANMCAFSKAHCDVRDLHLAHEGNCTAASGSSTSSPGAQASYLFFCMSLMQQACGTDFQIVCGSNGQTYNNLCLFEKARCLNHALTITDYQACPGA